MQISHDQSTPSRENRVVPSVCGHKPLLFNGQKGAILSLLLQNRGKWVPSYRLSAVALQYNARVKELRNAGFTIENKTERLDGKVHGAFRLVACPGDEVQQ